MKSILSKVGKTMSSRNVHVHLGMSLPQPCCGKLAMVIYVLKNAFKL